MIFAYVLNGALEKISSADTVEWNDSTITNVRMLTPEERKAIGIYDFIPATQPPKYHKAGGTTMVIDVEAGTVTETLEAIPFTPEEITAEKESMCNRIDAAADAARMMIAGDALRVVEYQRTEAEAKAFKDAGYTGTVPATVQTWAEAKGWTATQATDDILTVAAAWNQALYTLRDIRLKRKELVRAATNLTAAETQMSGALTDIGAVLAAAGL